MANREVALRLKSSDLILVILKRPHPDNRTLSFELRTCFSYTRWLSLRVIYLKIGRSDIFAEIACISPKQSQMWS